MSPDDITALAAVVQIPIVVAALIWALRSLEACMNRMDATIAHLLATLTDNPPLPPSQP